MTSRIPYNRPFVVGEEFENIRQAIELGHLSGDGTFTARCNQWLSSHTGAARALMTHSCTAALEMAALLLDIKSGDEIIMPSFTFVSTANAFVLRSATPVFVDIRPDTLNLDESLVEAAITPRTKAIVVVHYAGVACEMDAIIEIAAKHGIAVIEDAAQAVFSTYKGTPLGAIGDIGAISFHETKNVMAGEGGALLLRDDRFVDRAEIIREKGTNRSSFFRGEVDKYTWVDVGSSFLPSDIISAFLWAQLQRGEELTERRLGIWQRYHDAFADLESEGLVRRPIIPAHCNHNAHLYYLLLPTPEARNHFLDTARRDNIGAIFHYIPLHDSPAGRRYGRSSGALSTTSEVATTLVRLPLWIGVEDRLDELISRFRAAVIETR